MSGAKHISLFVFIDALGWQIANRYRFMEKSLSVRAPLGTIFGYSSTCDPTILTGKLPRDHGHFAFYYHNPEQSPFRWYRPLRWLPRSVMNRGRVRAKCSQYLKKLHGFSGYFQLYNMPFEHLYLFDYSERRDIFRPGGINSGIPTIFQILEQRGVPYALINDYMQTEESNLRELERAIATGEPVLAYILLGRLDALLHQYGTNSPEIAAHLEWYSQKLEHLVAHARAHYDDVRIFVFSDHGMTDINALCDLKGRINKLGLAFGRDYAAVYDSTMARFWFMNDRSRSLIRSALEEEPAGRILSDDELAEFGCDFPGKKYGELFFLMNPGVLLCPSFMGEKPLAGMHGYDPRHEASVAAFLSNVRPESMPRRLDDLYAVMLSEATAAVGAG